MKKHLVFLMMMALVAMGANAVTWKLHSSYVTAKIQNIVDTGDKVYYLNADHLFMFDKTTQTTQVLSRQNILSDNQVSQIYYDWENQLLFVAYASSNIDVIDRNGKVSNVSGIKDVLIRVHAFELDLANTYDILSDYVGKEIRDITFAGGKAYVAMGYGYAVIDEESLIVTNSYVLESETLAINSVTMVGDRLVILSNKYCYYGDPNEHDPIRNFDKKGGTFDGAKMFPINDNAVFVMSNSRLYYYDFSSGTPTLTSLVSALPTCVQKTPTGYIANFAGQAYYYTIDATGKTATKASSAAGFASSDPLGDGTVWVSDANGLHVQGSTAYYKMNSLTTDLPYWLEYNPTMDLLYASISGPIALLNNNTSVANVINVYDGSTWSDATAYTAAGGAYGFHFSPVTPSTYVRASWNKGIHKVTDNKLVATFTKTNSWICSYKPTPAFDNYGNLWNVNSYLTKSDTTAHIPTVSVLPVAKFNKTTLAKTDWFIPSGFESLETGAMQRSRFLVSKVNNAKIYTDGDYPENNKGYIFCWDNFNEDPTVDNYTLAKLTYIVDQNDRKAEWSYINRIRQDVNGTIWVGHNSGLFSIEPDMLFNEQPRGYRPYVTKASDGVGYYLCDGYTVYDIGVDRDNNKWLGTNDGVYYVSPDGSEVYNHFTTENSDLPSDMVYSVEVDSVHNRIYVFTDYGLYEYMPDGDAAALDYSDAYAFPNPVEPDFTGLVKIAKLMDDTYITITNRDGIIVKQMGPVLGSALWDASGEDGERVPTGLYNIYVGQGAYPAATGTPQTTIMVIK